MAPTQLKYVLSKFTLKEIFHLLNIINSNQFDSISKHIVIDVNIALRRCDAFIVRKKD